MDDGRAEDLGTWTGHGSFRVDPRNTARRSPLPCMYCAKANQPYHFRLEVRGDRTELARDGQMIASHPTEYSPAPDWQWLIYDLPSEAGVEPDRLKLEQGKFANSGEYRNGCSLFPSSGVAVLRQADDDFTETPTARSFAQLRPVWRRARAPHKLKPLLYAHGGSGFPLRHMPYETSDKAEWTAHTVSHNTVVVDGVSQRPSGKRNQQWPVDSVSERVVGKLDQFDPAAKLVAASCDSAYEGLTLRRTVRLCRHCVVDEFSVEPGEGVAARRRFDYVLHIDGDFADSSVLLQRVRPARRRFADTARRTEAGTTTAGAATLRFTSGDSNSALDRADREVRRGDRGGRPDHSPKRPNRCSSCGVRGAADL